MVYSTAAVLMVRFHEFWAVRDPPNVMSFQPLHQEFTAHVRAELASGQFALDHAWFH